MTTQTTFDAPEKHWTASELRKLPAEQRDAIMTAAALQAENDYRNDPHLTAFDAFGREDLHGESGCTQIHGG